MSRSIANVFREVGERHVAAGAKQLAAFIESLPTEDDYTRFMDAARAFLSFDWEIRNLRPDRRRKMLHVEGPDLAAALWQAAKRLLSENPLSKNKGSDLDKTRLLMAALIAGGLRGASDKEVLLKAALQLRELSANAQATRSESEGKNAHLERCRQRCPAGPADGSSEDGS